MLALLTALTLQAPAATPMADVRVTGGAALGLDADGPTLAWQHGYYGLLRIPLDDGELTLLPEFGVSATWDLKGVEDTYLVGGVGVGLSDGLFVMGIVPSFTWKLPSWDQGRGAGLQLTALAEIMQFIGIQASCQTVWVEGEGVQTHLMLTGSLNWVFAQWL